MGQEKSCEAKRFSKTAKRSIAELVHLLSKDIGSGNGQVNPYASVPDTQAKRSFVPTGRSKVMGEHDSKLLKEVRQLFS